ncbi:MAG: SWIM zinc finger family protein [Caldilinea sp.]
MSTFTEADIRTGASSQSFSRGMSYYRDDAVLALIRRDNVITAEVAGSEYEPYEITITLDETGGIRSAACTCPYTFGGYCKHIVATLLAILNDPEAIETQPAMESVLAGLTEVQLRTILLNVAAEERSVADLIEREAKLQRMADSAPVSISATAGASAASIPVLMPDLAAVRRELRRDFRKATSIGGGDSRRGYYYDDYDDFYLDASTILAPPLTAAEALLAGGDPAGAATLLSAVIEEWGECISGLEEWIYEANEDTLNEAASSIDSLLAESLLSLPLTDAERKTWRARIDDWMDDAISLAITETALKTWWDYPPLVAAMQGQITEQGAWEDDAPDHADALARVRLRILERQDRIEEYLNLAQAEGELVLYLTKLVAIGEIERVVSESTACLATPNEVLTVATALADQGHGRAALAVAALGLDLEYPYNKEALARWIAPLAKTQGDSELAVRAAKIAFFQTHTLTDYQAAEQMAGDAWPEVKDELLNELKQVRAYHAVDIFLYERMLVEAMAAVERSSYGLDLVIEAARADYPDWCIRQCKAQAERIMNNGQAKYYDTAADWLRRARQIYAQHNRLAEWQPYLTGLLDTHARKYKLVPMLKALR